MARRRAAQIREAADPAEADGLDRGITVRLAAELIGVDESYVYKLLRRQDLTGYRLEHGVRVWLSSVRAYQARRPYSAEKPAAAPAAAPKKGRPGAKYREAVAGLGRLGLRFAP